MPRFFVKDISETMAAIMGEDARHIAKSLRMKPGENIELCGEDGFEYFCELLSVSETLVTARVLVKKEIQSEPRVRVSLFQALPKAGKLEFIAQKAVELGVFDITPVVTSRCVCRWDKKDEGKKLERLQKIMLEAAKQSGRGIIPRINAPLDFKNAIAGMKSSRLQILFYEKAELPLREALSSNADTISVMVGSEGGFSPEEVLEAKENGVYPVSLGKRILRCETAPICALSAIMYSQGEF